MDLEDDDYVIEIKEEPLVELPFELIMNQVEEQTTEGDPLAIQPEPVVPPTEETHKTKKQLKKDKQLRDINLKLNVVREICKNFEEMYARLDPRNKTDNIQFYEDIAELTGTNTYLVYRAKREAKIKRIKNEFIKSNSINTDVATKAMQGEYYKTYVTQLRKTIVDCYINKRITPTKHLLINELCKLSEDFNEKKFDTLMDYAGYYWKRLPGTDKSIIVENSEQLYNKHRYLQQVVNYRQEGLPFVYIGEHRYGRMEPTLIAVNNKGVFRHLSVRNSNPKNCNQMLYSFINELVIPLLKNPSVFVMDERQPTELFLRPTEMSSRADMVKWLATKEVPYKHLCKAELYSIIKETSSEAYIYTVERLLKKFGHKLILRPRALCNLNYFEHISEITKRTKDKALALEITHNYFAKNGVELEKIIIKWEIKELKTEVQLEEIIDKLMTLAKYGKIDKKFLRGISSEKPKKENLSLL